MSAIVKTGYSKPLLCIFSLLLTLFLCTAWADTTTFKSDAQRTSFQSSASYQPPLFMAWKSTKRTVETDLVQYSSPVLGQGRIYIGNTNGKIDAYSTFVKSLNSLGEAENVAWSRDSDGSVFGTLTVDAVNGQDRVYAGTSNGTLYCLNGENGTVHWSINVGGGIYSSPLVMDIAGQRIVCVSTNAGTCLAYYAENGNLFWRSSLTAVKGYLFASPAYDVGTTSIIVPSYDGYVYSISASNGTLNWRTKTAPTRATPAIMYGRIYSLSNNGRLWVLDMDGTLKVDKQFGSFISSSPAIYPESGNIAIIACDNLDNRVNKLVYNPTNGMIMNGWNVPVGEGVYSTPMVINGNVFVGCNNGILYALRSSDGVIAGQFAMEGAAQTSPGFGLNALFIASNHFGALYAYSPQIASLSVEGPSTLALGETCDYIITALDSAGQPVNTFTGSLISFTTSGFLSPRRLSYITTIPTPMVGGKAVIKVRAIRSGNTTIVFYISDTIRTTKGVYVSYLTATPSSHTPTITRTSTSTPTPTHTYTLTNSPTRTISPTFTITPLPAPYPGAIVIRINAGGPEYISGSGTWVADRPYSAGSFGYLTDTPSSIHNSGSIQIGGTEDDPLYQTNRWGGNPVYRFDLPNDVYRITMKWAEPTINNVGDRIFDVYINGELYLDNLDLYSVAGIGNAYDRTYLYNVTNNKIEISLSGITESAFISAIEIVGMSAAPTITPTRTVLPSALQRRINCGGDSYTDSQGNVWIKDQAYQSESYGFTGGSAESTAHDIQGTSEGTLYKTVRYGLPFEYKFDVPNGVYQVNLKWSEIAFNSVNQRIFGVSLEGQSVLEGFDLFNFAGHDAAYDRSYDVVVRDGVLNIAFNRNVEYACINAIEVINIGPLSTPTITPTRTNTSTPTITSIPIAGLGDQWVLSTYDPAYGSRRGFASAVFDAGNGPEMWVIGGDAGGAAKNDVWHSRDGRNWEMQAANAGFGARSDSACVSFQNKLWILGGKSTDGTVYQDVWNTSDARAWNRDTDSAGFGPRWGHQCAVYDAKDGKGEQIWLLGGYSNGYLSNNLYCSMDGVQWENKTVWMDMPSRPNLFVYKDHLWIQGDNKILFSSDGISWISVNPIYSSYSYNRTDNINLVYSDNVWSIGGYDGANGYWTGYCKNDVWNSTNGGSWDLSTWHADFKDRMNHSGLVYDGKMWVLGGEDCYGTTLSDIWYSPPQPNCMIPFAKINFQPTYIAVPEGYVADTGLIYGARDNGYTYGWNADNTGATQYHYNGLSDDPRYNTFIHMQKEQNPDAYWEIEVPNGTYAVNLVSGDAELYGSPFKISVEGVLAINGTPTDDNRWLHVYTVVEVTDGKLTIENAEGSVGNLVNFIDIYSCGAPFTFTPTPSPTYTPTHYCTFDELKINFQPQNTDIPPSYEADYGDAFGDRYNGYRYGWNYENKVAVDRNSSLSLNQAYDTFNFLGYVSGQQRTWEIDIPNGRYNVSIVAGDPNTATDTYSIQTENVPVVSGTQTSSNRWISGNADINVYDSKMTISAAQDYTVNKICYVVIKCLGPAWTYTPTVTRTPTFICSEHVKINFQPQWVTPPSGYLIDSGEVFQTRSNGMSYGWTNGVIVRERNPYLSQDVRYNTHAVMQYAYELNNPWELEVPNGKYCVRIVAGDPDELYWHSYRINVEGVLIIDGGPTNERPWMEGTACVDASDGRLTVSSAEGSYLNRLCFIDITRCLPPPTLTPTRTATTIPGPQLTIFVSRPSINTREGLSEAVSINVKNTGNTVANNIAVTCSLSRNIVSIETSSPTPGTVQYGSPGRFVWNVGDISPSGAATITFAIHADPATLFASDFSVGELLDDWETTDPNLYYIDQGRLLVISPKLGYETNWLHTRNSIYHRQVDIDGSLEYLSRNQSTIKLTRNGIDAHANDYLRIQSDMDAQTIDVRVFNDTKASAALPATGKYRYRIHLDYENHLMDVYFYSTSDLVNPILEYHTSDPADVPPADSLYFGIFNNNGALLLNDDIRIVNPNRLSVNLPLNVCDMQFEAAPSGDPGAAATPQDVQLIIQGKPRISVSKLEEPVAPATIDYRMAYHSGDSIRYKIVYSDAGSEMAGGVRIWDTLPAVLGFVGYQADPGVTLESPPPGAAPGFLMWNIGSVILGASGTITMTTQVRDLSEIKANVLFKDDFDYLTQSALLNLWKSDTPEMFQPLGNSSLIRTIKGNSNLLVLKDPVYFGDDLARLTAKFRFNDYGPAIFKFLAGEHPLMSLQTDSNNVYINVWDNSGAEHIQQVGTFEPNVDYYLEFIFNRVARDATLRLIDSRTGYSILGMDTFYATNLATYPAINVGFAGSSFTSLSVDSIQISSEDIDQSASMTCDYYLSHLQSKKRTSIPHNFSWIEMPFLMLSKYGPSQVASGAPFDYIVVIQNHGTVPAIGVRVTDTLPMGLMYTGADPAPYSTDQFLAWNISQVDAYSSTSITIHVQGTASDQTLSNKAVAKAENTGGVVITSEWAVRVAGGATPTATMQASFTPTATPEGVVILSFAANPNPFDPDESQADINYELSNDASVDIAITDEDENTVYEGHCDRSSNGGREGFNHVSWSGRKDGFRLPNGKYHVTARARNNYVEDMDHIWVHISKWGWGGATMTPAITPFRAPTETSTRTMTFTPTSTPTSTKTSTISPTLTNTPMYTLTGTRTKTPTLMPTFTYTMTPIPGGSGRVCMVSASSGNIVYFNTSNSPPSTDVGGNTWKDVGFQPGADWRPASEVADPPDTWIAPCHIGDSTQPKWIAAFANAIPPTLADAYFRGTFEIPVNSIATSASFVLTGDNIVEAWVNGTFLGRFEGPYLDDSRLYSRCVTVAVNLSILRAGTNVAAFRVINQKTRHGLEYEICVEYQEVSVPGMVATATSTPTATTTITPTPTETVGIELVRNVFAGPNVSRGGKPIYFHIVLNEESSVKVKILSIFGENVYASNALCQKGVNAISWDLRNNSNADMASGLYLYVIDIRGSSGRSDVRKGKVVIIR